MNYVDLNAMKYGWTTIGWHELWWDPGIPAYPAEERVGVEETLINMQHSSMSAKMGVRLGAVDGMLCWMFPQRVIDVSYMLWRWEVKFVTGAQSMIHTLRAAEVNVNV